MASSFLKNVNMAVASTNPVVPAMGRAKPAEPAPKNILNPIGGILPNVSTPANTIPAMGKVMGTSARIAAAKAASVGVPLESASAAIAASKQAVKQSAAARLMTGGSGGDSGGTTAPSPTQQAAAQAAAQVASGSGQIVPYRQEEQAATYQQPEAQYQAPPEQGQPSAYEDYNPSALSQLASQGIPLSTLAQQTDTVAAQTQVAPKGPTTFWQKFLDLFGLYTPPVTATATMGGEDGSKTLAQAAESLVRRARNGDQNAMATISLVRQNALKGNARARQSFELMKQYAGAVAIDPNRPDIGGESYFGTDRPESFVEAVKLANGPPLTDDRIRALWTGLDQRHQAQFAHGMRTATKPIRPHGRAGRIGEAVGIARAIQATRVPHAQLRKIDPVMAWELGE